MDYETLIDLLQQERKLKNATDTTIMNFEQILETCLQRRNFFVNMNETERRAFFEKALHEVKSNEPFGRLYFNINMINDPHIRKDLYFQFATGIARYYNSILHRGLDENITSFMFKAVEKLTRKRLDQQEMYEEDGIDR